MLRIIIGPISVFKKRHHSYSKTMMSSMTIRTQGKQVGCIIIFRIVIQMMYFMWTHHGKVAVAQSTFISLPYQNLTSQCLTKTIYIYIRIHIKQKHCQNKRHTFANHILK